MEAKMKKRVLALLGVVALVGLLLPAVVFSAEGTVTCTVSAVLVSLTVSPGSVDYGALPLQATRNTALLNQWSNPLGMEIPQTQTITNTGTVQEDFRIKTSNAVGAANWTLHPTTLGADTFMHAWKWDNTPYTGLDVITFTQWTAANTYVVSGFDVPPGEQRYLELQIGMPTSVTDYGAHNITVTVEAVQG
jgi:hypothetical protein